MPAHWGVAERNAPGRRAFGRLAVAALMLAVLATGCGGGESDDEEEKPAAAPPRVSTSGGQTVVTLDAAALAAAGIEVAAPAAATHRDEARGWGRVLDVTDLADARGAFVAAAARGSRSQAALAASRAELERARSLASADQATSAKSLETATAAARADEAEQAAADGAIAALRASTRQRWGGEVAAWCERGAPELDALLRQADRLVQVTLPAGASIASAPRTASLRAASGAALEGRLVSEAPRTDPGIQGPSFLYLVPSAPALLPGASVDAVVPAGEARAGVVVPAAAVVWSGGRAWVYVELGPGRYARREVATDAPVEGGFFVSAGLTGADRIVVRGAQVLLSEEGRAAVHGAEG